MNLKEQLSGTEITLSKEDLKGEYTNIHDCPIARAIKRRLKENNLSYQKITITPGFINIQFSSETTVFFTYNDKIDDAIQNYKYLGLLSRLFLGKIKLTLN